MATMRAKRQQPVGSADWILDERGQAMDMVDQEVEGFTFSARNELEWLNEHMADIFSRTQFNVPEVYQTPGKLRGKTPRTARKRNPLESRVPLTDVFAPNNQTITTSLSKQKAANSKSPFKIAEDKENQEQDRPISKDIFNGNRVNTDSGYHEMTENEPDNGNIVHKTPPPVFALHSKSKHESSSHIVNTQIPSEDRIRSKTSTVTVPVAHHDHPVKSQLCNPEDSSSDPIQKPSQFNVSKVETGSSSNNASKDEEHLLVQSSPRRASSSSEVSSPERPIVRKKSSLTFASLPAREPLATKKSMGARVSQSHQSDTVRNTQALRDSTFGKFSIGRSLGGLNRVTSHEEEEEEEDPLAQDPNFHQHILNDKSDASRLHNKTSTQRLHERITMLGKLNPSQPQRTTISNHTFSDTEGTVTGVAKHSSPRLQKADLHDEEWIGPMSPKVSGNSLADHQKIRELEPAVSTKEIVKNDEAKDEDIQAAQVPKSGSSLEPSFPSSIESVQETTTPAGSPLRRNGDGPLSAAKASFNFLMQSAKSMLASSAAASAQAKMETMSPSASRSRKIDNTQIVASPKKEEIKLVVEVPVSTTEHKDSDQNSIRPGDCSPVKKKRLSQRIFEQMQKSGTNNKSSPQASHVLSEVEPKEDGTLMNETHTANSAIRKVEKEDTAPVKHTSEAPTSRIPNQGEPRRPAKLTKETTHKAKPAAVPIKLASQRVNQFGPSTAALGASLHDSLAPQKSAQPPPKPQLTKKGSSSSLRTASSSHSIKGSSNSTLHRPAALIAADRKKAQEEKEIRRREENKREIERKRAAKAEEEKRQAQEQRAAEQQKALESKLAAQKQANEQRKAEAIRKNEQHRSQQVVQRPTTADGSERDRQLQHESKAEQSNHRPPPRLVNNSMDAGRAPAPHMNPAKPPKRYFQPEEDDDQPRQGVGQKIMQPNTQHSVKRRKTSEEGMNDAPQRPTIGAPIRQSTIRKDVPNKFAHGYMNANSTQGGSAMLKNAVSASHQMQHPKTPLVQNVKQSNTAYTPFGEVQNPPQSQYRSNGRPPQTVTKVPSTAHKSSPHYPNGDNISLPEIATDSEDSDDEDGFVAPDWADSPALRELLRQQQLVDPMKVFGPIAPLQMEEVFKGTSKDRQARFRARTSSANWNGPDKLTEEERRRDHEARARLQNEGTWSFQPGI